MDCCCLFLVSKCLASPRTTISTKTKKFDLGAWFIERVSFHIRGGPRGEKTAECLENSFLSAYAGKPVEFSLSDPRVEHVLSCNHCFPRLLDIRDAGTPNVHPARRYVELATVGLACLFVGLFVVSVWNRRRPLAVEARRAAVSRTLDLFSYGTYLGEEGGKQPPLVLTAALLKLELILPRLSEPGMYSVTVAADRTGRGRIAFAEAAAISSDQKTVLNVPLDLRAAAPGNYFLSIELQGEDAADSYPLNIQYE